MKHAPRPAVRVLLAGRFAVSRGALLARPAGPVNGIDLSRGAPVVLELRASGPRPAGHDVRRHRGGWVIASEPRAASAPVPPLADVPVPARAAPRRAPARLVSLRRELGTRRVRLTALAAAGVACSLVAAGLLGGTHAAGTPAARAAAPPVLRLVPPVVRSHPAAATHRAAVAPAVRPAARGGAARVLVVAPPARRRPPVHVREPLPARHAIVRAQTPARSTGWVAGLFVGG